MRLIRQHCIGCTAIAPPLSSLRAAFAAGCAADPFTLHWPGSADRVAVTSVFGIDVIDKSALRLALAMALGIFILPGKLSGVPDSDRRGTAIDYPHEPSHH